MNTYSNLSSRISRALGASAVLCCGVLGAVPSIAEDAYIESDGSQFINTGYYVSPSSKVELDFAFVDFANTSTYVQTRVFDNNPTARFPNLACTLYVAGKVEDGNHTQAFALGDRETGELLTGIWASSECDNYGNAAKGQFCDNVRRTAVVDEANHYAALLDVNGAYVWRKAKPTTSTIGNRKYTYTHTALRPLVLFGCPTSNDGSTADYRATARIYGFRIYEDGELLHDYVPALKGGEAGLYDTIGGGFLRNGYASGNPLAHGGDIRIIPDDGYVSTFGNNSSAGIGELYFDTRYPVTKNTRAELDYSLAMNYPTSGYDGNHNWYLFAGSGSSSSGYTRFNAYFNNNTSASFGISGGGIHWKNPTPNIPKPTNQVNVRHVAFVDNYKGVAGMLTDGLTNSTYAIPAQADLNFSANTLKIAKSSKSNEFGYAPLKIYGFKIYEEDALVRSYKPYVQNGIPGLLDTVGAGGFISAAVTTNALNIGYGGLIDSDTASKEAYIETIASAKQSIDTGYSVGPNTRIEFSFALTGTKEDGALAGDWYLLDNQISSPAYKVNFLYQYKSGKFMWSCGSTAWQNLSSPLPAVGIRHTVVMDCHAKTLSVASANGTSGTISIASPPASVMTGNTLRLGSRYNGTSCWAGIRIFFCRISEYDATTGEYDLKHEFVPYTDGSQVGLYDAVEGGVKGDVLNSAVPLTLTGMGVDGAEKWVKELPATATVPTEGSITLTAAAAGAKSYKWTKNGEVVAGATGETCAAAWRKGDYSTPDIYACTAIYDVFGVETEGEPVSCNVFSTPSAFVMVVR